jgi:uncharacterized protein (TIGR03435 family)
LAGICEIIRIAYDVKSYQVIGVPATLGFSGQDKIAQASPAASLAESGKQPVYFYDIDARAPGTSPPSEGQAREMLRALLADRFHLTLHRDRSALSYYALTAVNGAAKLKPAAEGCKPQRNPELLDACGQTMEQLARFLIAHADRPVVDMTGISGKFDYEIPISRAEPIDFRALAASLQEHLKLKLEARNGPIEILVVDHVERPSTN